MVDETDPTEETGQSENLEDDTDSTSRRLEYLLPSLVRRAIAQGVDVLGDETLREKVVNEVVRKAVTKGSEVVDVTEESLRRLVSELPASKELADRLIGRADEYKSELFRLLRDELKEFLDHLDLGQELQKALGSMTLEMKTEIRFVPRTAEDDQHKPPEADTKKKAAKATTPRKRARATKKKS